MDTRVIPSENVSTANRMVVATIRKETRRNRIGRTFQRQSVNIKTFMKPDINRKYQEEISYKLAQLPNKLNSAEKGWIDFKDIIQGTAEKMVGQKMSGGQQKKVTTWWNEETRQDTKLKKQLYKMWLKDQKPKKKTSISQPAMQANKLPNMPKKRHGQSMVTNWRICEKQRR